MDLNDWLKLLVPFRTWLERLGLLCVLIILAGSGILMFYVPYQLGLAAGREDCTVRYLIGEPRR